MSEALKTGLLVRVSSRKQAESDSPEHHRIRGKAYCEARHWELVTEYGMEGVKGDDAPTHPEYLRMLDDVRAGRVKVVICSYISRLARDFPAMVELGELFQQHGAHIVSIGEGVDTSTSMGRIFFFLLALFADLERQKIAERVADVVPVRLALGKHMGGQAVYGYQWIDGALTVAEDEAAVRRLIYALYLDPKYGRCQSVARELNRRGYRTRDELAWHGGYIANLIEDPTAIGRRASNTTRKGDDGRPVLLPESEWIWHDAPAIIDAATWQAANARLAKQRENPRRKRTFHPFSGLVWCHCGCKMYNDARPVSGRAYRCTRAGCGNRIPTPLLERVFLDQIEAFYCAPETESEQVDSLTAALRRCEEQISQVARRQAENDALQTRAERDYRAGDLPAKFFQVEYATCEATRATLAAEAERLTGERAALQTELSTVTADVEQAKEVRVLWEDLDLDGRRVLVDEIVRRVEVQPDTIRLRIARRMGAIRILQRASESAIYHLGYTHDSDEATATLKAKRPRADRRKRRTAKQTLDALLFPLTLLTLRLLGPGLRWA